jgi:adenylate kinase
LRVVITAVKGAGKTTVTEYLKKKMSNVAIFNYGDYFQKVLEEKFPEFKGTSRDLWDKTLSKDQQRLVQVKAAELIKRGMEGVEHSLIDVNLVLRREDGYLPGLPRDVLELLNPDVIVVMEVDPEIIQERRRMDPKRQREVETIDEIEKEQELQRIFAANCALLTGCLIEILDFRERKDRGYKDAEDAAKRIKEIFTGIRAGR